MKQPLVAALIVLLLAAAPVLAADEQALNQTLEGAGKGGGFLDGVLDGVKGAAEGVGDAAEGIGDGVGKAADATFDLLGTVLLGTLEGIAQTGAAVSQGLLAAGEGVLVGLGGLGSGMTFLFAWTGIVVGKGFAFLGGAIASLGGLYWGFVEGLRPEKMPVGAFVAITSSGAAVSAGAGGWAGLNALKKWGMVGTGLGGVAGFSRIDNDQLLEHPLRHDLFSTIQNHPGIHASQLARELDVGWGTITHHLDKLSRAKLITSRKVNNQKCFFEQGGNVSREDMAIASALKGDTAGSIAEFVQTNPMTSQKQMAEALGISAALASFHVKKLVNLGVLDKVRHGKETLLSTSDGLRRVMLSQDPVVAQQLQESGFEYHS